MERLRNGLYIVLVACFGGAAIVHLTMRAVALALTAADIQSPSWLWFGIPVPILQDFGDPVRRFVDLLFARSPHYDAWYGSLLSSLAVAVLAIWRVRAWKVARVLAAPASFRGFLFGLGLVGMAALLLGELGGWRLVYPIEPIAAGAMLCFVAFLMAELFSLAGARETLAGAAELAQAPSARRRPVWTVLAIALPFVIAGAGWALAASMGTGSLAPVAVLLIAIAAGFALGAVATLIALLRRERWIALQVVAFLLNFGSGLLLIAK